MYCLLLARTPPFIATRRFVRRHVPIESRAPLPQHTATTCVHVSGAHLLQPAVPWPLQPRCLCCNRVVSCCNRVASCCAAVVPGASSHCFEPNAHVRAARLRTTCNIATLQHCNIATLRHALHAALPRYPRGKLYRWGPHTMHACKPSGLQCAGRALGVRCAALPALVGLNSACRVAPRLPDGATAEAPSMTRNMRAGRRGGLSGSRSKWEQV
jgi:hypothetical protein